MASVAHDLGEIIVSAIEGLSLAVGAAEPAVEQRKLPAVAEELDTLPMILVVPPATPDRDVPFDSEGARLQEYGYQVVIVAAGNRDAVTNLETWRDWRQQIADRFGTVRPIDYPGFLPPLKVLHDAAIDRATVAMNYDYSGLTLRIQVVRTP